MAHLLLYRHHKYKLPKHFDNVQTLWAVQTFSFSLFMQNNTIICIWLFWTSLFKDWNILIFQEEAYINPPLKSYTGLLWGHGERPLSFCLSSRPAGFCSLESKHKAGLIKSNVSLKQASASPSKTINGTLCLGLLDAGQRAEPVSRTHTNSTAQSYQIPVLAPDKFKHKVPRGGGEGEGEEKKRRVGWGRVERGAHRGSETEKHVWHGFNPSVFTQALPAL